MRTKKICYQSLFMLCLLSFPMGIWAYSLDGIIGGNEYPYSFTTEDGDYTFAWRIEGSTAFFGMSSPTIGWVAIGFDPTDLMDSADIVLGWVDENGNVSVIDTYSVGPYGPHPTDEELGGKDNILHYGGIEADGVTTIEFSRQLSTGDEYDNPIHAEGGNKLIWAYGSSDDPNQIHKSMGYTWLAAEQKELPRNGLSFLLIIHIVTMSSSFAAMTVGMLVSRFMRKKRWWLKVHRILGIVGTIIGVIGVGTAVFMIWTYSGAHLRVIHSYFGLITIIVIIASPFMGHGILKIKKEYKPLFRKIHRWLGRVALLLMLITIILGLFQAGIL